MRTFWKVCLVGLFVLAIPAAAQVKVKMVPGRYVSPADGKQLYTTYCASCHGSDLSGNRLLTSVGYKTDLKTAKFHSAYHVRSKIQFGTEHGSKMVKMPAWGLLLREAYRGDELKTELAIQNLKEYIVSQSKP